jgi:DNA-binding transcriptional LysR family regulator
MIYSHEMDGEALSTFLMVYRHRGFSNAARVLNRTQPAISHRISLLEQDLGIPLFERTSTGIALTQAGRVLLPYAERALAALQDAETAVRALKTEDAGPLSLAVVGTLASTSLTGILKQFAADHPFVDLALQTTRSTEVSDLVRRGEATMGVRYDRDGSPDLQYECLGRERMLVTCPTDHGMAGSSIRSLAELVRERWIAFPEIPGQREIWASHVFSIFQTFGLGEIKWTPVDSLTAQKRLVEAGFGIALMMESAVKEELSAGTLATIDVKDLTLSIPIFLVTRDGGFLSAAAVRLRKLLSTNYLGLEPVHVGNESQAMV